MTRRVLSGFIAVLVAVGMWWILDRAEIINPPTAEMQQLRAVEATLELPEPYQRSEDDSGCRRDYKGAEHCERHVFFYYESNDYWPDLAGRLDSLGWLTYQPPASGTLVFDRAWNGDTEDPICLSHHSDPDSSAVFLMSSTDEVCRAILAVLGS